MIPWTLTFNTCATKYPITIKFSGLESADQGLHSSATYFISKEMYLAKSVTLWWLERQNEVVISQFKVGVLKREQ